MTPSTLQKKSVVAAFTSDPCGLNHVIDNDLENAEPVIPTENADRSNNLGFALAGLGSGHRDSLILGNQPLTGSEPHPASSVYPIPGVSPAKNPTHNFSDDQQDWRQPAWRGVARTGPLQRNLHSVSMGSELLLRSDSQPTPAVTGSRTNESEGSVYPDLGTSRNRLASREVACRTGLPFGEVGQPAASPPSEQCHWCPQREAVAVYESDWVGIVGACHHCAHDLRLNHAHERSGVFA